MPYTFGQSSNQFTRAVLNTTNNFIKREELNILRRRRLPALMREKGRIKYGVDGLDPIWSIRYRRIPPSYFGDVASLSYQREVRNKNASLPWRGMAWKDAMGYMEKLVNRGPSAIFKQTEKIMEGLKEDAADGFGLELWKDGNAGTQENVHGLESCLAFGSQAANNLAWLPNDSYGGHSTVPGLIGDWTGNWPDGDGDAEYEWWSPIGVNPTGTGWAATTKTWPNTGLEALRYGIIAAERTTKSLDVVILKRESFRQVKELFSEKEAIDVQRNGQQSLLVKLGFTNVVNLDGVDITWEEGVDSTNALNHGFGLTLDKMELCCLEKQLFVSHPVDFSMETLTDRHLLTFAGNMRLNPRHIVKWIDAAA